LGSDLRFVRYLGQQSYLKPVGRGIVLGWNGRLGLGDGIGQEIVLSDERFFAGGGTTVRGYKENSLGPRDVFGDPMGGEALLVSNQEMRFPIWKYVQGGVFVDVGNVFPQPSEIKFSELEVGAGFGLRFVTPIGVLRFDLGVPVTGGGLGKSRLHFAFGQIF
jgi:outer membrane protein insertion porin family